jgi:hypothetical protein
MRERARQSVFKIHPLPPPSMGRGARVGIAALLEVRIEDRIAGRAPARLRYLGESGVVHYFIR